ncbi:MAG TPA: DUF1080 domain-containing protein, partial [Candidatus Limnocylindrales bacterium]|nr:DUF1080 domain-containing protein [Candidatus Limnocylindrales bacterium]
ARKTFGSEWARNGAWLCNLASSNRVMPRRRDSERKRFASPLFPLDGSNPKTLDNWNRIADANWRAEDGAIVADKGKGGHLVSQNSYKDFQIRAEFWADHTTNSGIFFRISDPKTIGSKSAYEANIYDQRPDPEYGTGIPQCGQDISDAQSRRQWNNYEITGQRLASDDRVQWFQNCRYPARPVYRRSDLAAVCQS